MVLESFSLKGKTAIVTGGAGLLGKKHVEAILEAGGNAVVWDLVEPSPETDKTLFSKVNITNEDDIQKALQTAKTKFGTIDILINNAAIDPKVKQSETKSLSRLEFFERAQWDLEISVGLTGAFLCTKHVGAEMHRNGHGVILNIASDLGIIAPDQRLYQKPTLSENLQPVKPVTYSVIKHGLIGLTKYTATYWPTTLRANTLCPGGVYNDQPEEFVHKLTQLIPNGRMATKDEYKAAIVFLTSDASTYMNGATIVMDGGRSVW